MQFRFGVNTAAVSCLFYRKCLCFLHSGFSSNNVVSVDITRLRNWFCSSLEDRPSEAWQDRDSNDLMRWAEECRAQTESLPTPISGQRRRRHINILDSVSALSGSDTHCKWIWLTRRHFIQSHQTAQHLGEVQAQQQVTGFEWLLEGETESDDMRQSSDTAVFFKRFLTLKNSLCQCFF